MLKVKYFICITVYEYFLVSKFDLAFLCQLFFFTLLPIHLQDSFSLLGKKAVHFEEGCFYFFLIMLQYEINSEQWTKMPRWVFSKDLFRISVWYLPHRDIWQRWHYRGGEGSNDVSSLERALWTCSCHWGRHIERNHFDALLAMSYISWKFVGKKTIIGSHLALGLANYAVKLGGEK